MNTYTPESINKPNTYNVGGKEYKVEGFIKANVTETGEQFFIPLVDIPMSDYHWQLSCLMSRLEHPELYQDEEDGPAEIEKIKHWLAEHTPESG